MHFILLVFQFNSQQFSGCRGDSYNSYHTKMPATFAENSQLYKSDKLAKNSEKKVV